MADFPASARVTAQRDFARARRSGRTLGDDVLRITIVENGLPRSRLGLAVPRRTTAVERNRVKRLVREAFRARRESLPPGYDFVVAPRNHERACDAAAVFQSFTSLTRRAFEGRAP